jgi:hypothetical protein
MPNFQPERWEFYDVNLNAVKEEITKNVSMTGGMSKEKWEEHEQFMNLLSEHIRRLDRAPEAGEYDPHQIETKLEVDFSKAQPRFPEVDLDELVDMDKEGDVLILDPEKPQKRLPQVNFDKQIGRTDNEKYVDADNELEEVIITDPINLDMVKKRAVMGGINMDK